MKMVTIHSVASLADAQESLKRIGYHCKKTHFGKITHAAYLTDERSGNKILVTTFKTTVSKYWLRYASKKKYFIPIKGVVFPVNGLEKRGK